MAPAGIGRRAGGMRLGRRNKGRVGIAGGRARTKFDPGVQIVDVIEDATTDFSVFWSGAVRPVLFQRASAKADDWCPSFVRRYFWGASAGPFDIARSPFGFAVVLACRDARNGRWSN
ncbi:MULTISPECIES: hypothetical protein [unclassified Mesorhizobium]|uniref:hypothetical protein n=1 Tax=unclassified Mesorhizobium TaxID=325217 RepID=UPI0029624BCB|nr:MULTISPECIES: hypothetical protein [unclassified Mesorhizobium]